MKQQLEEEYQAALAENEKRMMEMQKNYEQLLKEAEESDAVSYMQNAKIIEHTF